MGIINKKLRIGVGIILFLYLSFILRAYFIYSIYKNDELDGDGVPDIYKYDNDFTPIINFLFDFKNTKKDRSDLLVLTIFFLFNLFLSSFFWRYLLKWHKKNDSNKLSFKLLLLFLIVTIILLFLTFILAYLTKSLLFFIFFMYYLPMGILVILMVPLFKFNQWVVDRLSK